MYLLRDVWFVATLLHSAAGRASLLQSGSKEPGPTLDNAVIMRGVDELSLSQNAMVFARDSQKSAQASQHELLGEEALVKTSDDYDKIKAYVPEVCSGQPTRTSRRRGFGQDFGRLR